MVHLTMEKRFILKYHKDLKDLLTKTSMSYY